MECALWYRHNATTAPNVMAARKFSTNMDPVTRKTRGVETNTAAIVMATGRDTSDRPAWNNNKAITANIAKFRRRAANSPPIILSTA